MRPPSKNPTSPPIPVLKRLFAVSKNVCAFPECDNPVVDPVSKEIVVEICHIRGKPGGPRYDPSQSNLSRHGFDNLLLLCGTHHKIVDNQPTEYTVEVLTEFKKRSRAEPNGAVPVSNEKIEELFRRLEQSSPTQSVAITDSPGSVVHVHSGMSYADVRSLAIDIYEQNAVRVLGQAKEIAEARARALFEELIVNLEKQGVPPQSMLDPDVQYALSAAGQSAARRGPEATGVLVDLLTARVKSTNTLLSIILGESIAVAGKLTGPDFDLLSLIFVVRHTKWNVSTKEELEAQISTNIAPLLSFDLTEASSRFPHLHYCGCVASADQRQTLEEILGADHPHVFLTDVSRKEIAAMLAFQEAPRVWEMFIPTQEPEHFALIPVWSRKMTELLLDRRPAASTKDSPYSALRALEKSASRILRQSKLNVPCYEAFRDIWFSFGRAVALTSVGIALAHANLIRRGLIKGELSTWLLDMTESATWI